MLIKSQPEPSNHLAKLIPLGRRGFTLVDPDDYERFAKYHYHLVMSGSCFYVMRRVHRNGKTYYIRLHREIMHTPAGCECHHKNRNPLDNRQANLENLTPAEHRAKHNRY